MGSKTTLCASPYYDNLLPCSAAYNWRSNRCLMHAVKCKRVRLYVSASPFSARNSDSQQMMDVGRLTCGQENKGNIKKSLKSMVSP